MQVFLIFSVFFCLSSCAIVFNIVFGKIEIFDPLQIFVRILQNFTKLQNILDRGRNKRQSEKVKKAFPVSKKLTTDSLFVQLKFSELKPECDIFVEGSIGNVIVRAKDTKWRPNWAKFEPLTSRLVSVHPEWINWNAAPGRWIPLCMPSCKPMLAKREFIHARNNRSFVSKRTMKKEIEFVLS